MTSGGHVSHSTAADADTTGVGPIVEMAIQRSPILYIRNGSVCVLWPVVKYESDVWDSC